MQTVKFIDSNGNSFFECKPAEARKAIKSVCESRNREPLSLKSLFGKVTGYPVHVETGGDDREFFKFPEDVNNTGNYKYFSDPTGRMDDSFLAKIMVESVASCRTCICTGGRLTITGINIACEMIETSNSCCVITDTFPPGQKFDGFSQTAAYAIMEWPLWFMGNPKFLKSSFSEIVHMSETEKESLSKGINSGTLEMELPGFLVQKYSTNELGKKVLVQKTGILRSEGAYGMGIIEVPVRRLRVMPIEAMPDNTILIACDKHVGWIAEDGKSGTICIPGLAKVEVRQE